MMNIPSYMDPINRSRHKWEKKGLIEANNACFVAKLYKSPLKIWKKAILMKLLAMNEI